MVRKVGTTQSTILPNGKVSGYGHNRSRATESAAENNRRCLCFSEPDSLKHKQVRVKTWGKSPRVPLATWASGKPYGLQGQICQGLRVARPILAGRPHDHSGDVVAR